MNSLPVIPDLASVPDAIGGPVVSGPLSTPSALRIGSPANVVRAHSVPTTDQRLAAADTLCAAAAGCHPDDRWVLLTGILRQSCAGMPIAPFLDDIACEAESWAVIGQDAELEIYGAAIVAEFASRPSGIAALKRLLVEIWNHLPPTDRTRFFARVDACGAFTRKDAA